MIAIGKLIKIIKMQHLILLKVFDAIKIAELLIRNWGMEAQLSGEVAVSRND